MVAVFCVFVPFSFFPTIIESLTRAMLSIGNPLRNIAKNPTMTHLAKKKSRKKNFFFFLASIGIESSLHAARNST